LPDFSEILRGEAVFHIEFRQRTDTRVPPERIFCIPNAVLASASGGFRIFSGTLVEMLGKARAV